MAELSKDQVIDYLRNLPVMEIAALVKELEAKWGVSAAATATGAAALTPHLPSSSFTSAAISMTGRLLR